MQPEAQSASNAMEEYMSEGDFDSAYVIVGLQNGGWKQASKYRYRTDAGSFHYLK